MVGLDANVMFHTSLSEEKLRKLETIHLPVPQVIYGTLPRCKIFLGGKDGFFKDLIKPWSFTWICPAVVALSICMIEMDANLTWGSNYILYHNKLKSNGIGWFVQQKQIYLYFTCYLTSLWSQKLVKIIFCKCMYIYGKDAYLCTIF